jgi:hypothetical protein
VAQRIRVNTENLRKYAVTFDHLASLIGENGTTLIQVANSVNDFGGQLPIQKDSLDTQLGANNIRNILQEEAERLQTLARQFEEVDNEAVSVFTPPPPRWISPFEDVIRKLRRFRLGWDPNTPDGTVVRPGDNDFGPTQNIDLRKLLDDPDFYFPPKKEDDTSRHLCGVLCLFTIAGVGLLEGIQIMLAAGGRFADILKSDAYTSPQDLVELCKLLGLKTGELKTFPSGTTIDPEEFQEVLDNGGKMVVLVNAKCPPDTITDPGNGPLNSSHWVDVTDMWSDSEGTLWVEVYNPYNNQYEVYRWDTLEASMQRPGTGSPGGGYYLPVYPGDNESPNPDADGNYPPESE